MISYEGKRYAINVEHQQVQINTYRYTATKIADNPSAYAQQMKNEYLFTLSDLSDAEQKLIETAITEKDGYVVKNGENDTFRAVIERFRHHEAVQEDFTGDGWMWLVQYDGEIYIAYLSYPDYTD